MPMTLLGLVFATALVILAFVLISPHRRRRGVRDEGCGYTSDGGWNPAFVSGDTGDSGSSDCGGGDAAGGDAGGGDAGGGCDGGGGGGSD